MKKLMVLTLLVMLSGCVTYYYPETALEDGVYYAEDDPSYVVHQSAYGYAGYYPWVSLDYFYWGFNPYPRYAYFHGFPFGFAYGYSPWHYPYTYYGYYSPLYASYYHYPYFPVWRPYGGYCSYQGGYCQSNGWHDRRNRGDRLAKDNHRKRGKKHKDDQVLPVDDPESPTAENRNGEEPFTRYAMTAPYGYGGSRGLIVNSGETKKIGKSRTQPSRSNSVKNGLVIAPSPSITGVNAHNQATTAVAPMSNSARSGTSRPTSAAGSHRSATMAPRTSPSYSSRPRASIRSSSRGTSRGRYSPARQKRD